MENNQLKILIVDDVEDNLITMQALILESFPEAKVWSCNNGMDALSLAVEIDPVLILLDIIMPDMDGYEVCRRLKAESRTLQIPVVFVTALKGDKEHRIQALEAGAEGFLSKPVDRSELIAQVKAMIKVREINMIGQTKQVQLQYLIDHQSEELQQVHIATLNLLEDLHRENESRKKTEEILRASEERYKAVTQTANDAIITTNGMGFILNWNKGAERIFEFRENEMLGENLSVIIPKKMQYKHEVYFSDLNNSTAGDVFGKTMELIANKRNGEEFPVELTLSLWENAGDKFVTAIIRDITQRKNAEDEIQKSHERLKLTNNEKDKLFSIIAHDLKSPINGFLALTKMMTDDIRDLSLDEISKIAHTLNRSAINIFKLLENLLQWSRMQLGGIVFTPRNITLYPFVEDCLQIFSDQIEQKGVKVLNNITDGTEIFGDSAMLQTVFRNIISNAIKYSESGGTVIISLESFESNKYLIHVKDEGTGIDENLFPILFKLDEMKLRKGTSGEPGTGLGLIICKDFIERNGGELWVKSIIGQGADFYFTLPTSA